MTETPRGNATYSPDDNKLRFYPLHRLDAEHYKEIKAAGFKWAPKQDLFVAPKWTPAREDLLLAWCGEIDDEDQSLADRAELRAERFDGYSEKRAREAKSARDAVDAIADNIPLGQPILVGHHSERRARKDAERIENGMRKAVKLWRTSEYWTARAAGALYHAKHKELPAVRARRIKTLEAERRGVERDKAGTLKRIEAWKVISAIADPEKKHAAALHFCNFSGGERVIVLPDGSEYWSVWGALQDGKVTADYVAEQRLKNLPKIIPYYDRWLEHYDNRLVYERAMLAEQGASNLLDRKPKSAKAQSPLLNYRAAEGVLCTNRYRRGETIHYQQVEMTKAEYAAIHSDYKGTCWSADHSHRLRMAIVRGVLSLVFLTDSKVHDTPAPKPLPEAKPEAAMLERCEQHEQSRIEVKPHKEEDAAAADFEAMDQSLRAGIQVVAAPQLFPTPVDVAERMASFANIRPGDAVLEPSAGTGRLIEAVEAAEPEAVVTAIEIDPRLSGRLVVRHPGKVHCADFLECSPDAFGPFDVVMMNPPFAGGVDIKHIQHARGFLKPGGRLVAICANGPRQARELQELATHWEVLPAGTFQGTQVSAVFLVIDG